MFYLGIAAPEAKLSFDDVSMDGTTLTAIPDVLSTGLWQVSQEAGAHIHSNSWGWSVDFYTISESKMSFSMMVCV